MIRVSLADHGVIRTTSQRRLAPRRRDQKQASLGISRYRFERPDRSACRPDQFVKFSRPWLNLVPWPRRTVNLRSLLWTTHECDSCALALGGCRRPGRDHATGSYRPANERLSWGRGKGRTWRMACRHGCDGNAPPRRAHEESSALIASDTRRLDDAACGRSRLVVPPGGDRVAPRRRRRVRLGLRNTILGFATSAWPIGDLAEERRSMTWACPRRRWSLPGRAPRLCQSGSLPPPTPH